MKDGFPFSLFVRRIIQAFIIGCCVVKSVVAADLNDVKSSLLKDIRASQQKLNEESRKIARQSEALALELNRETEGLTELRSRAAAVRRQSDEQLLSLASLEERIKAWRSQDSYRQNLLWDFASRQEGPIESLDSTELGPLKSALVRVRAELTPTFASVDVVTESGEVIQAEHLKLGPVHWFLTQDSSGLLHRDGGTTLKIGHRFIGPSEEAVNRVKGFERALLAFDPTIDRLLKTRVAPPSFLEQLAVGGTWILPILGFGMLATLIAIAKFAQFLRLPRIVPIGSRSDAKNLGLKLPKGPQQEIIEIAHLNTDADKRDDLLFALLVAERSRLERFLGAIAVTATVSPLLGLLGTVSGMISTFNMMTLFGAGDPSIVSGGISEALVTTELGLIVAIPALIMHALLSRKAGSYVESLEACAIAITRSPGNAS